MFHSDRLKSNPIQTAKLLARQETQSRNKQKKKSKESREKSAAVNPLIVICKHTTRPRIDVRRFRPRRRKQALSIHCPVISPVSTPLTHSAPVIVGGSARRAVGACAAHACCLQFASTGAFAVVDKA